MATFQAITTNDENYNPENEYTCFLLMVDGEEVGFANLEVGEYEAYLQDVAIFSKYKGKGFFTKFINELFTAMKTIDTIYCDHRNEESNPIFEKWAGCELGFDESVKIQKDLFDEEADFTVTLA